jgi:cyclopropane-fatty-acyl-phospholipid synthase
MKPLSKATKAGPHRVRHRRRITVRDSIKPLLESLLPLGVPVRMKFWDGTSIDEAREHGALDFRSPDALRRLAWSPNELGLARAYVAGDVDIVGDVPNVLRALQKAAADDYFFGPESVARVFTAAARVGALGRPLPPPPEELIPVGARHSRRRDSQVVRHHYDVGNEFYRLLLGPSMTYSCARFPSADTTLEDAQASKHDLVCRKLGLHNRLTTRSTRSTRLLDVGCGWGSMALHAASVYGADVVGVTLSEAQSDEARRRVREAGLDAKIEIRLQDFRDIRGERFDAISSIGMFEHVGRESVEAYFATMRELVNEHGRLLNHAISSVGGSRLDRNSFLNRYVFPDGELFDVGDTILAMERAGFEVRDVESLREHYARTLQCWLNNLNDGFDHACEIVGERRARVWKLYISGCINGFQDGGVSIHQVLGVIPNKSGESAMPATRRSWDLAR